MGGFALLAAALVAGLQVALGAMLYLGWLPVPAYALAAIALPSAAVGWLLRSQARLLCRLHSAMHEFEAGARCCASSCAGPGNSRCLTRAVSSAVRSRLF